MVNNIGKAIVNMISIKIEGNKAHSICYKDLWLTKRQLENLVYQGIESHNITKLRVGAGDALTDANGENDKAIADAYYGNRFYVSGLAPPPPPPPPEQRYWQNRETANIGLVSSVGRAQAGGRRSQAQIPL